MTRSDKVCSLVYQQHLIGHTTDGRGKDSATLSYMTKARISNVEPNDYLQPL